MYIRCLLDQSTFIASNCLLTQRRQATQAPGNATPSRLLNLVLISKKCGSFSGVTKLCRIKKSTYTSPQLGFISPEWRASISSGIVRSYAMSLVYEPMSSIRITHCERFNLVVKWCWTNIFCRVLMGEGKIIKVFNFCPTMDLDDLFYEFWIMDRERTRL